MLRSIRFRLLRIHKIDGAGATAQNEFTEGDPGAGVPATVVTDDWMNMVQRELVAILAAAEPPMTPTKGDDDQLLEALREKGIIRKLKYGDTELSLPSAGGAAKLKHLTAGLKFLLESGAADALANLQLREPGVGRGWDIAAGAATKVLQFAFEAATGGGSNAKITFDDLGNINSIGNAAKSNNGYVRLMNGMILQWGRVTTTINPGDAQGTVTFPLAFPTNCYFALACPRNNSGSTTQGCWAEVKSFTASQLTFMVQYAGSGSNQMEGLYWLALGE